MEIRGISEVRTKFARTIRPDALMHDDNVLHPAANMQAAQMSRSIPNRLSLIDLEHLWPERRELFQLPHDVANETSHLLIMET